MKELEMSDYIVCNKKRNNPRMNIRICQKKCKLIEKCKEYLSYHENLAQSENGPLSAESQSIGLATT